MSEIFFTTKSLDSIKPKEKLSEFFDSNSSLPGFCLRVSPKGTKSWSLLYRYRGRLRRLGLGRYPLTSLAIARQKARDALGQLARGEDPCTGRDAFRTSRRFEDIANDYVDFYAKVKKHKSWARDKATIAKYFLPGWRDLKITEIGRRDIAQLLQPIARRGKGIMANRCLSLIRTILEFAVQGDWIKENPARGMRRLASENVRDRTLSHQELRAVWLALDHEPPQISAIFRLQLLTAQRIGEVMSMSWKQLDLGARWWTIPPARSKNKRTHQVPLVDYAVGIIRSQQITLNDPTWVFPAIKVKDGHFRMCAVQRAVVRLRKRTGINFNTHDFRRTAATEMSSILVPEQVVGKLLNHSRTGVTQQHYIWSQYDAAKRIALEAWEKRLNDIVNDQVHDTASGNVIPMFGTNR